MAHPVGASVGLLGSLVWGLLFAGAGTVVAAGWLPGSDGWALGPRIGIATVLIVLGVTVVGFASAHQFARGDAPGNCPVGATCGCGHFNFKPRRTCRQCGTATVFDGASTQ